MSSMLLEGDAWCFGRNVDTDVIIPARYLDTTDVKEMASHCMEDLDPDFCTRVK
jgi:3-isopropylmalate/(R)-2-methylmalate dehydratase small subunit